MAKEVLIRLDMTLIPSRITAGTTLSVSGTLTAHPADSWAFTLVLRGPGAYDVEATAEGVSWLLEASAATTAEWTSGRYWYALRASLDGQVVEVESGHLDVLPDLAAQGADYDGRTHVERVLSAIEAVIENRATKDQQRYVIAGRELWLTPVPDLLKLRDSYRADLVRERNAAKGRSRLIGRAVRVVLP